MPEEKKKDSKEEKKKEVLQIQPSETFNFQNYINQYSGNTKIYRAIFIAEHCKELEVEALKVAHDEVQKTAHTTLYRQICEKLGDRAGDKYKLSEEWANSTDKKTGRTSEQLENDLNNAKTRLSKDEIRECHNALGQFHYNRGDLPSALKCYVRTRDYTLNRDHTIAMCRNVIKVSIELGNFAHVTNYVSKAQQNLEQQGTPDSNVLAALRVDLALANLTSRKYKLAAEELLKTTPAIGSSYNEVIAVSDIAHYITIFALATFERTKIRGMLEPPNKSEIQSQEAFDNAQKLYLTVKAFLEEKPILRRILEDFYNSKYSSCLKNLEILKPDLLFDIHLHDLVSPLYKKIRERALVQYFTPYKSVDLKPMSEAFGTTIKELEVELGGLILSGSISARIDSHNQRLLAREIDQRSTTFKRVLTTGNEFQENTSSMLLRVNMMRNDFFVKFPKREDKERKGKKDEKKN